MSFVINKCMLWAEQESRSISAIQRAATMFDPLSVTATIALFDKPNSFIVDFIFSQIRKAVCGCGNNSVFNVNTWILKFMLKWIRYTMNARFLWLSVQQSNVMDILCGKFLIYVIHRSLKFLYRSNSALSATFSALGKLSIWCHLQKSWKPYFSVRQNGSKSNALTKASSRDTMNLSSSLDLFFFVHPGSGLVEHVRYYTLRLII